MPPLLLAISGAVVGQWASIVPDADPPVLVLRLGRNGWYEVISRSEDPNAKFIVEADGSFHATKHEVILETTRDQFTARIDGDELVLFERRFRPVHLPPLGNFGLPGTWTNIEDGEPPTMIELRHNGTFRIATLDRAETSTGTYTVDGRDVVLRGDTTQRVRLSWDGSFELGGRAFVKEAGTRPPGDYPPHDRIPIFDEDE